MPVVQLMSGWEYSSQKQCIFQTLYLELHHVSQLCPVRFAKMTHTSSSERLFSSGSYRRSCRGGVCGSRLGGLLVFGLETRGDILDCSKGRNSICICYHFQQICPEFTCAEPFTFWYLPVLEKSDPFFKPSVVPKESRSWLLLCLNIVGTADMIEYLQLDALLHRLSCLLIFFSTFPWLIHQLASKWIFLCIIAFKGLQPFHCDSVVFPPKKRHVIHVLLQLQLGTSDIALPKSFQCFSSALAVTLDLNRQDIKLNPPLWLAVLSLLELSKPEQLSQQVVCLDYWWWFLVDFSTLALPGTTQLLAVCLLLGAAQSGTCQRRISRI